MATRSFDTNTEKEGFEKVETYSYDSYGRQTGIAMDDPSTAGIDNYISYERDLFGNITKKVNMDSSKAVINQVEYERNLYGQHSKTVYLTKTGEVDWTRSLTYNAHGRAIREQDDRSKIGVWDNGDNIKEFTRSDDAVGLIVARKSTYHNVKGDVTTNVIFTYDDYNRQVLELEDKDGNGEISVGENYLKRIYEESSTLNLATTYHYMTGAEDEDILRYTVRVNREVEGDAISRFISNNKGEFETLVYDGWGVQKSSTEDYTEERFQALFDKFGGKLKTLNLSNETQSTEITFDNDTLAKMTAGRLVINGDKTDTINLKDGSEFSKQEATVKEGANDYVQYTTEVGGDTYTLLIDTDVNVNLL
ncbi:hypothetical protein ACERCG_12000 [Mannheimia sp. E30BD]|uniref:hypothetical protein n=1 Tax=Mannheimia sp. E30BD TaxID=3278708 RepID=UPI00359EA344